MKNVYCMSGIGADATAFYKLQLDECCNLIPIEWIHPIVNESVASYAQRLSTQIKHEKPVLLGLSFGGILALEMAKIMNIEKVIQISSAKVTKDIKLLTRIMGNIGLLKINPASYALTPNKITYKLFGVQNDSEKELMIPIFENTDRNFFNWAYNAIGKWRNDTIPSNVISIKGTADRIMPYRKQTADYTVDGGGHLMIVQRSEEIRNIIKKELC